MSIMRYLLFVMACCISVVVFSQHSELHYEFSDSVDSAILRGLNRARTDSVYVEFYDRKGELNVIAVRRFRLYGGELLAAVVGSSRSVEIAGKKLPIMFDEDMQFDRHLRRYIVEGNGYMIKFTNEGKVLEEYETQ